MHLLINSLLIILALLWVQRFIIRQAGTTCTRICITGTG